MALYAFDGTWNEEKDTGEYGKNTNVVKFRDAYDGKREFYTKGVGTRHGLIGKIFGGAFGAGGHDRIREGQTALFANFRNGDEDIDIIGFSRGAALALHFANMIASEGVSDPESGERLAEKPPIRFLGLWDVVAAFGIPIDIGIPFSRINLGYRLKLPDNVKHCFHALALDELRQTFRPTRVNGGYEVWFRGVHSDIGGGNDNEALSHIALRWMLRKAIKAGLPIRPGSDRMLDAKIDPNAKVSKNKDLIKNGPREIKTGDLVHYSVTNREGHVNPAANAPIESDMNETERLKP
jgi:uncharacterized protein (DUF2235 family)